MSLSVNTFTNKLARYKDECFVEENNTLVRSLHFSPGLDFRESDFEQQEDEA